MNRPAEQLECLATTNLVQEILDGTVSSETAENEQHFKSCVTCHERLRSAKFLLASLKVDRQSITVPSGLTDSILGTIHTRDRVQLRQRIVAAVGTCLAIAASVVLVLWLRTPPVQNDMKPQEIVVAPPTIPPQPELAPPMRLGDELAKASDALRDTTRTLTEPAASMPTAFVSLANALLRPAGQPAFATLEPARKSLSDIPEAAKIGFEPVTSSAQKAYTRFLRDVSAVKPNS